jgi:ferrous iron transport protein A
LGCYSGEPITVVARRRGGWTVAIKDGRYNIDDQLAAAIVVDWFFGTAEPVPLILRHS